MTFRSAVDAWFVVLGLVLPAGTLVAVGLAVGIPDTTTAVALAAAVMLALGLPLWLLFSTDYTLVGGALRIRCGPFRWRIPLRDIHSVTPSRSPLSSPALSLDRLEIRYGNDRSLLVSPADRPGFLRALEACLPAGKGRPAA